MLYSFHSLPLFLAGAASELLQEKFTPFSDWLRQDLQRIRKVYSIRTQQGIEKPPETCIIAELPGLCFSFPLASGRPALSDFAGLIQLS